MNIKCPHCGKLLQLKQQISDFNKIVTCPVCKESSPLSSFRIVEIQSQSDHTQFNIQGGQTRHGGEGIGNNGNSTIGSIINLASPNDPPHKLKMGCNIIGRAWEGNVKTDIPIHTPGKNRMSREHLIIEVKEVPNKGIVHYASLYKEKINPTYINKEQIMFGDCLILKDNDTIDLPDASLKFTLQEDQNQYNTTFS